MQRMLIGSIVTAILLAGCGNAQPTAAEIDVAALAADSSAYQSEILADGVVTYAEHERSTLAMVQCLRDAGLDVEGPAPRSDGTGILAYSYAVLGTADDEPDDLQARGDEAYAACAAEYENAVARVYEHQNRLTVEERSQLRAPLLECLVDAGLSLTTESDDAELADAVASDTRGLASPCLQRYGAYFHVPVGS